MIHDGRVKPLLMLSSGACALLCIAYLIVQIFKKDEDKQSSKKEEGKKENSELLSYLECLDKPDDKVDEIVLALHKLTNLAAFVQIQVLIRELGYLPKIIRLLSHPDVQVKQRTASLINNLSLNIDNQETLRDAISMLAHILETCVVNPTTVMMFTSTLQALTNLTTLNNSHVIILPYVPLLCDLLEQCDIVQIKLQVLKVLVNLSTNSKICENKLELDAQLLHAVEPYTYIDNDEAFVLRAVTCCANVLTSLHRRWEHGGKSSIATPEFVSEALKTNFIALTSHGNEDIEYQAKRAMVALRTPTMKSNNMNSSTVEEIDLLEILKI